MAFVNRAICTCFIFPLILSLFFFEIFNHSKTPDRFSLLCALELCVFACAAGWGWDGRLDVAVREFLEDPKFTAQREHRAVFLGQQPPGLPALRLRTQVRVVIEVQHIGGCLCLSVLR